MNLVGDQDQPYQHDDGPAGAAGSIAGIHHLGETDGDQDDRPIAPEETHRHAKIVQEKEHADSDYRKSEDESSTDGATVRFRCGLPGSVVAGFHICSPD